MLTKNTIDKKAIVLLSGGIDSTTTMVYAIKQGYKIYALSFDYSQKNIAELDYAKKLCKIYQESVVEHKVFNCNLSSISQSSLVNKDHDIPNGNNNKNTEIPSTYVALRNMIFLSIASSWGETINVFDIFIGANVVDYSNYPDCRADFIKSFEATANIGSKTKNEFKIHTPLINKTKASIITLGNSLKIDYSNTRSCYSDSQKGFCGNCDACLIRNKGFSQNNLVDPLTKTTS